jgi:hypothetical protein
MGAGGEYTLYTPDESDVDGYVVTAAEYAYEFEYISLSVMTVFAFVTLFTVFFNTNFIVYVLDGMTDTPVNIF